MTVLMKRVGKGVVSINCCITTASTSCVKSALSWKHIVVATTTTKTNYIIRVITTTTKTNYITRVITTTTNQKAIKSVVGANMLRYQYGRYIEPAVCI